MNRIRSNDFCVTVHFLHTWYDWQISDFLGFTVLQREEIENDRPIIAKSSLWRGFLAGAS